jgi:hypothetical protein
VPLASDLSETNHGHTLGATRPGTQRPWPHRMVVMGAEGASKENQQAEKTKVTRVGKVGIADPPCTYKVGLLAVFPLALLLFTSLYLFVLRMPPSGAACDAPSERASGSLGSRERDVRWLKSNPQITDGRGALKQDLS